MGGRGELTEQAWSFIAPLLPSSSGRRDGLWDQILAHVQTRSDAVGEVVWEVSVDSSTARAHQHASGARRRPSRADQKRGSGIRATRVSGAVAGADNQVPPGLRRQGPAALDRHHARAPA